MLGNFGSLVERLQRAGEIDTVLRHIRQGMLTSLAPWPPEILRSRQDQLKLQETIQEIIEQYEPRLQDVSLTTAAPSQDPLGLRVEANATLGLSTGHEVVHLPFWLAMTVLPSGEVAAMRGRLAAERQDVSRLLASVLQHLQKMLNVHRGSVPLWPSYGMPDFNDMAAQFPDAILEIQQAIQTSIRRYEPRLHQVRVRYVPDDTERFRLRFEITAHLAVPGEMPVVWFESLLDTSGYVVIRR